jgi:predicted deacetylase
VVAPLIVSLPVADDGSGLQPYVESFAATLTDRGLPLSLLVRPVGPAGPMTPGSRLAGWLRDRHDGGDALVLNGYDHSHRALGPQRRIPRPEFAALPEHEATLRLAAARWVTDRAGLDIGAFVPPGWRASAGTLTALAARDFAVCADETGLHLLAGPVPSLVRARLFGFRGVAPTDAWRARLLFAETARTARRGGLVRIAVRGDDVRRPERLQAVLAAVDLVLAAGATGATYASLVAARRAA